MRYLLLAVLAHLSVLAQAAVFVAMKVADVIVIGDV
jgi:hypothetical protein